MRDDAMSRGKVYLIDDDPFVLRALDFLISSEGYEVESLGDAASYLACATPRAPACLVLDVRMGGMSGFDLQAAIVGTERALPVVFITSHGDDQVRVRAMAAGAVDVLFKPLDETVLFEAIERALAEPRH